MTQTITKLGRDDCTFKGNIHKEATLKKKSEGDKKSLSNYNTKLTPRCNLFFCDYFGASERRTLRATLFDAILQAFDLLLLHTFRQFF